MVRSRTERMRALGASRASASASETSPLATSSATTEDDCEAGGSGNVENDARARSDGARSWWRRRSVGLACVAIGAVAALSVGAVGKGDLLLGWQTRAGGTAGGDGASAGDARGGARLNAVREVRDASTNARAGRGGMWIDAVERVAAADASRGVDARARGGLWMRSFAPRIGSVDENEGDENATASTATELSPEEAEAARLVYADEVWIENYAEALRREEREKYLRKRGIDPKDPAVRALPKLGATRDDCPTAYSDANLTERQHNVTVSALGGGAPVPPGFTRFSSHSTKLALLADHIYIVCTKCSLGIPPEWRGKTSFVHGFEIDACLKTEGVNHWLKASFTHAHALMDAKKRGYGTVAMIEEDVITRDLAGEEDGLKVLYSNMARVKEAQKQVPEWQTIRLGYRTMFIDRPWESASKIVGNEKCPKMCVCDRVNEFTCVMRSNGCDMRSSDFYLVRKESFESIIESIYRGHTIDCEALSQVKNQIFITPQLSFQRTLDLSLQKQIELSEKFAQACALDASEPKKQIRHHN